MVTNKLKELEAARARIADLERAVASELRAELAGLPAKYGFETTKEFIAAVRAAGGARRGRPAGSTKRSGAGQARRRRAVITDETRASVKKMVEAGKTGAEIAKSLKISLPSVQNVKKALGLVKKR
jgi:DNA invertase Pin-like site-specific DNA recombinase